MRAHPCITSSNFCPIRNAYLGKRDVTMRTHLLGYISLFCVNSVFILIEFSLLFARYFDSLSKMSRKSQNRRFFSRLRKTWMKNIRRLCCFSAGERFFLYIFNTWNANSYSDKWYYIFTRIYTCTTLWYNIARNFKLKQFS